MKPTKPFDPKDLLAETCEYTGGDGDSLPLWMHGLIIVACVAIFAAVLFVAGVL